MLANAIFQPDNSVGPRLRFMENNDLPRFIDGHSIEQTRMVAALLFSFDGIPMIYSGQEIGFPIHPYSKGAFFKKDQSIASLDTTDMFRFYKKLIAVRNKYSALRRGDITKVYQSSEQGILGFRRSTENEVIHVFINLSDVPQSIDMGKMMDKGSRPTTIVDLVTDEEFSFDRKASQHQVSLPGYSTRWLTLKK
jgi:glycosidase